MQLQVLPLLCIPCVLVLSQPLPRDPNALDVDNWRPNRDPEGRSGRRMDGPVPGSPRDGSGRGPIRTAPYPARRRMGNPDQDELPLQAMAHLKIYFWLAHLKIYFWLCVPYLLYHLQPRRQMILPRSQWNESMVNYQLMAWGDGGIADPRISHQKFPDHIQTHLWKIAAALKTVQMYNGAFSGTANSASTYNFTMFKEMNVTACVPLPYLFLIGNFSFDNGINCIKCRLYSCVNSSIEFNLL
ncbi:uncharacterized protein LOC118356788 isoform X2 [Zalophus californianus]|uniref:Uncharacterized protein LOC118356788 isoform X2 n=1 Tax=Zalophus californianus TaxID=9704 RepID=A0A6P9FIP5_ZALCA|nr:uncharacterized protein LOC118356788 isoform X2 [Zalophus californianus]